MQAHPLLGFILLSIFIVVLLYHPWFVSLAFVLAAILVPTLVLFLVEAFQILFLNKSADFKEVFAIAGIFSFVGVLIYLVLMMPAYSVLSRITQLPIIFTFPFAVTIIMLLIFFIFANKPLNYGDTFIRVSVIATCSVLHSLFILWLISKLKQFSS